MTDKEIKKLKRADLLEILYYLQKEIEELTKENESLKKIMENQQLSLSENELKRITKAVKSVTRDAVREMMQKDDLDEENNNTTANTNEKGKQHNGKGKNNKT
jgi:hypothetical protein